MTDYDVNRESKEEFFRAASHEAEKFNYPTNASRAARTRMKIFSPFKRFWANCTGDRKTYEA